MHLQLLAVVFEFCNMMKMFAVLCRQLTQAGSQAGSSAQALVEPGRVKNALSTANAQAAAQAVVSAREMPYLNELPHACLSGQLQLNPHCIMNH